VRMNAFVLTVAVGLTGAALAAPYQHPSYSYAIDLPASWTATGADDANPAAFTGPEAVAARVRVTVRPQAMTPELAARIQRDDAEKVAVKYPRSKAFPIGSGKIAGLDAHHYGFVYVDGSAYPKVVRFALASRPAAAGHMWLKFQFAYARPAHAAVTPAVDAFLKAFRFVEQPVIARPAGGGTDPGAGGGLADHAATAAALGAIQPPPPEAAPAGPPGEQNDADSQYYLSLNQKMSEKDTQAHVETFRGDGEKRTEEEMARARSYGIGDVLKPNE
jgi:hypothetical protein